MTSRSWALGVMRSLKSIVKTVDIIPVAEGANPSLRDYPDILSLGKYVFVSYSMYV